MNTSEGAHNLELAISGTLAQVFDQSPAFMSVVVGPEFVMERANQKFYEFTGLDPTCLGKKLADLMPELTNQGFIDLLTKVYETGEPHVGNEVEYFKKVGTETERRFVDFVYQPLRDSAGNVFGILRHGFDITEKVLSRLEIEDYRGAIANERENFRNLFKQTPEMVCILKGPEHVFEFVNEAHIKALGFDATGMPVRFAQPESVEVHGLLDGVYQTGKTAELHEIPVTLTDRVRYFNLTYSARRDVNGEINGVMILGQEVTEQVVARESMKLMSRLIEKMPSPFTAVDSDWKLIFWNPAAANLIGMTPKEVLGKKLWDVFPALEQSDFGKAYHTAMDEKKTAVAEAYYEDFDKWFQAWAFPFENGIAVSFVDISDRKRIETEIERSNQRYKLFFDASPVPKFIFDPETFEFLDVNETMCRQYGYSKEEFYQMKATDIRPKEDVEIFKTKNREYFDPSAARFHGTFRHTRKDGTVFPVEVTSHDLLLNGRRARLSQVVDVTDKVESANRQRELFESLKVAKDEAERANELKSAFLANMSHEIRTPLGAMIGFADLLRDPSLSVTERANYIDILARNGESLSVIINDILDLSKVESGHLALEFTDIFPDQIAADVVSLLRVKAKEKDLNFEFTFDDSTPNTIVSDPTRVRQILLNIVGNAIKFTQFGSVKIRSFGCKTETGKAAVCFEVTDTGIGIPESQKDKVFEMFVQADGSMTRRFGGTGLGLALSRRLARSLGGEITVTQTQQGKGSTFLVHIEDQPERRNTESTMQHEEIKRVAEPQVNALSGVRVLVVDDAPDNQQLIWHYLAKQGAIIESAENGLLGYRKALAGDFDIVLMDIQMPEMDGYTATQKLRAAGFTKPIIALTAHAMSEIRQKCLNVGCTGYLPKPINRKELIATISEQIKN